VGNLKTIVLGKPSGGSSFTYKVIKEYLKKLNPNYKDYRLDEIKNIYSNFKIKLDV
jgi:hypothetical protein